MEGRGILSTRTHLLSKLSHNADKSTKSVSLRVTGDIYLFAHGHASSGSRGNTGVIERAQKPITLSPRSLQPSKYTGLLAGGPELMGTSRQFKTLL